MNAVLELPPATYAVVSRQASEAWALQNPQQAGQWYLADQQKELRKSKYFPTTRVFAANVVGNLGRVKGADAAIAALNQLHRSEDVIGAWSAIERMNAKKDAIKELVADKLKAFTDEERLNLKMNDSETWAAIEAVLKL